MTTAVESDSTQQSVDPAVISQHVFQLIGGYMMSTALYAATSLRVAQHLADGARPVSELARVTGANEDALFRVLRVLASAGVFAEVSPRTFANTPASSLLIPGVPGSLYEMVVWTADPFHLRVYADAMHSVMTGQPAIEKTVGMPAFEYLRTDPALSETFNNAMSAFSAMVIPAALAAYDFSGIGTLVDVAGGHGGVLIPILQKYPSMRGVLFDLDHVIAGAAPRMRAAGVEGRMSTVAGDFFKAVPEGGDAYIMKHIIHDWDDERSVTILRNIGTAMKPGGRVILIESILRPGNEPDFGKLIDFEMLLLPGGRERSEAEFRALFEKAGFALTRIVPTQSPLSVLEARINGETEKAE